MTELDLVFLCDTTGSMGSYLNAAQQSIEKIINTIIQSEKCDVRFALVEYKDHPPQDSSFAFRLTDFTDSMKCIKEAVNKMDANGGGDTPESVCCAMHCASNLKYREKAAKVIVWIGDAPPHGFIREGDGFPKGCPCGCDLLKEVRECMNKDIVIYCVGAEPLTSEYLRTLMRAVAQLTGGQYAALASANVLGELITNGAIEEIQMKGVINHIKEVLEKDPSFKALPPNEKQKRAKEEIEKQTKSTEIEGIEIETIFKHELAPIPQIFLIAESLKDLKDKMYEMPDIQVEFKDGLFTTQNRFMRGMMVGCAAVPMVRAGVCFEAVHPCCFEAVHPCCFEEARGVETDELVEEKARGELEERIATQEIRKKKGRVTKEQSERMKQRINNWYK
ncbi:elongation factor-2 kinase [Entamoeba histolytica HM-3:IMSS]|uniref:Elongation factor-2 kinase n=1 Tax=Entamoeba histolytica HM-3:IMSS TaxID=885315 RepID=M7WEK7_ENTHI|nr:elongation factor-2 kinase [Entamoeba histolytica HM-3:IMSS]